VDEFADIINYAKFYPFGSEILILWRSIEKRSR